LMKRRGLNRRQLGKEIVGNLVDVVCIVVLTARVVGAPHQKLFVELVADTYRADRKIVLKDGMIVEDSLPFAEAVVKQAQNG